MTTYYLLTYYLPLTNFLLTTHYLLLTTHLLLAPYYMVGTQAAAAAACRDREGGRASVWWPLGGDVGGRAEGCGLCSRDRLLAALAQRVARRDDRRPH